MAIQIFTYNNQFMDSRLKISDKVDLLFIGNLEHNQEYALHSTRRKKYQPHTDEILFKKAVKVHLFRIVRPKRQIYKKYNSITQSQKPIKNFEIFFRNLSQSNCSRYSLLTKSDEMLANPNDDILIISKEGIYTDVLVIRGFFTKITVCVYGYLLKEQVIREKCINFGNDVKIQKNFNIGPSMIDKNAPTVSKSELLQSIIESVQNGNIHLNMDYVQTWHEVNNDDEINQTQIRHITLISENLQTTLFELQNNKTPSTLASFRNQIQDLAAELNKIFRSKHLGLYYPTSFRPSQVFPYLPQTLPLILLKCLKMSQSDQYRALQVLRFLLQIQRMANIFVNNNGVEELLKLYFIMNAEEIFSTIKVLCLEVILVLSQFEIAALQLVKNFIGDQKVYDLLNNKKKDLKIEEKQEKKSKSKEIYRYRSRSNSKSKERKKRSQKKSRSKKKEKSKQKKNKSKDRKKQDKKKKKDEQTSSDSQSSREKKREKKSKDRKDKKKQQKKKEKKDKSRSRGKQKQKKQRQKQKQREREREREKQKQKEREKQRQRQRQRERQKERQRQKEREKEKKEKQKQIQKKKKQKMTFYQILLVYYRKDYPYKQTYYIKLIIQQLTHTLMKNKDLTQQIALYTPLLRQTRFLFNPSKQLVNNKTLKIFATYQPFLNNYQSKNVQKSNYVAEIIKMQNPLAYQINIKLYKIMNAINGKILFGQYDQEFILLMSQLLISEQNVFLGINRLVQAIKAPNIKHHEAILITLYEYIYKVLLQDEGMLTVLYIDQIFNALLSITKMIKQQRIASRELARSTKFLLNYAIVFDYFQKENILKALSESFLKIFKYVHIEASKFLQYEQISTNHPLQFQTLKENFNLGSFFQLLPEQPLLEIDVCLKLFIVLTKYNKNIWTNFYEYKLTNGFAILLNKISYLLIFFLRKNITAEYISSELQFRNKLIDNYLSVVTKLLVLFLQKIKYQSGFNELSPEDNFQEIELYNICLDLFQEALNTQFDEEVRILPLSRKKFKKMLILIAQIYINTCQAYQFSKNKTRQKKLKFILDKIYISHFQKISSRYQILTIFTLLLRVSKGISNQLINNYFISKFDYQPEIFEKELSLVSKSQKTIIENLIKYNVYRSDIFVRNSLINLVNQLTKPIHYNTTLAVFRILQSIFKQNLQELKSVPPNATKSKDKQYKIFLQKMILYLDFLSKILDNGIKNMMLHYQLEDQFLKLLKFVQEEKDAFETKTEFEKIEINYYFTLLKFRNSLLKIFIHLYHPQKTLNSINIMLGVDVPDTLSHQTLYKYINKFLQLPTILLDRIWNKPSESMEQIPNYDDQISLEEKANILLTDQIISQLLESIYLSLQICNSSSKSIITQTILLYSQYIENAYNPEPLINIKPLFQTIISVAEFSSKKFQQNKNSQKLLSIFESSLFFLVLLTENPKKGMFNCQRRKIAIKSLLGEKVNLSILQNISFLNQVYIKYLSIYFNTPNLPEIKITKDTQRTKDILQIFKLFKQKRQNLKNQSNTNAKIFQNYSNTLLDIIIEGEQIAKARYRSVCNDWIGGDINAVYKPLSTINADTLIEQILSNLSMKDHNIELSTYEIKKYRTLIQYNQTQVFHSKKQYPQRVKRTGHSTITLKQIPNQLTASIQESISRQSGVNKITQSNIYSKNYYVSPTTQSPSQFNYTAANENFSSSNINPSTPVKYIPPPTTNIHPILPTTPVSINNPINSITHNSPSHSGNAGYNDYMYYYQSHHHNQPMMNNYIPTPQYGGMQMYNNPNTNNMNMVPTLKKTNSQYQYMLLQQQQQQQQQHQHHQQQHHQQQQFQYQQQQHYVSNVYGQNVNNDKQIMNRAMDIIFNIKTASDESAKQKLSMQLQRILHSFPKIRQEIQRRFK